MASMSPSFNIFSYEEGIRHYCMSQYRWHVPRKIHQTAQSAILLSRFVWFLLHTLQSILQQSKCPTHNQLNTIN